jgi:hypothetical protein
VAGTLTVTALDPFGNVATGYSGTVHFTNSDPKALLPADTALTPGTGTFQITLETAGTQSITATDTAANSITGAEASIHVTPAATSQLALTALSPVTAGVAGKLTVTAEDAFGNFTPAYHGTIHFTSSDKKAVLPADSKLTGGVGTFRAKLKTTGSQSVTATDTETPAITGSETGITVVPPPPLSWSSSPSPKT